MRLVAQLPNDDDVTGSLDHVDKLDQLIKPERNFESSIFLTVNKMATVFPVLTTSSNLDSTLVKGYGGSGSQRKPEPLVDISEAGCRLRNSGVKEPLVSVHSQEDSHSLLPRSSNIKLQSDPQSSSSVRTDYQKQMCTNSVERVEGSKGRSSSGFQETVVAAFIEQQKFDANNTKDKAAPECLRSSSSDNSENQISREDNITDVKLFQNDVCNSNVCGETKSSNQFSYSLSPYGMPPDTRENITVHATPDITNPATEERTNLKKETLQDTQDGCPDVLMLPKSTSLSSSIVSSVITDSEYQQRLTQKASPPAEVASGDDVIISEIVSRSPEPARRAEPENLGQKGGGTARKGLSARISKRLMNLFQKHPASNPAILESAHTEGQEKSSTASGKKDHGKKATRQSSFTGRLMTSVSEWRRKPPNPVKDVSRSRKHKKPEIEDAVEPQNNNTGRVPIFVSPQDQVEIVEDAPVGIRQEQKTILRESWSVIKSDVEEVGVETFMGLFHTHPDSIDSFLAFKDKAVEDIEKSAVLKAHALRVMQTVDKCITRLDDVDKMATVLCQLGRRHVGFRANASLVPMIGKQFISAIEPKMADKWSNEVCKAWDCLFSIINYNLRRGMMQEKHRLHDEATAKQKK